MDQRFRWLLTAALFVLCALPPQVSAAGELSLIVGTSEGLFGGDATIRWTSLGYVRGDRLRIAIEVPFLELDSTSGVVATSLGPVEDPRRRRDSGESGSTEGEGPASGTTPAATTATALIDAPIEAAAAGSTRETVSGVGDVRLALTGRIAGGGVQQFRLDAGVRLKAPTADEEMGLGTGAWDLRLGLAGEYRFWSLTGFAGAGWNRLGDPEGVELSDVLDLYAGIQSQPIRQRLILSSWVEGNEEVLDGAGARASIGAGLRTLGRVRFELQALAGIGDSAEDFSVSAGFAFGTWARAAGPRRVSR